MSNGPNICIVHANDDNRRNVIVTSSPCPNAIKMFQRILIRNFVCANGKAIMIPDTFRTPNAEWMRKKAFHFEIEFILSYGTMLSQINEPIKSDDRHVSVVGIMIAVHANSEATNPSDGELNCVVSRRDRCSLF